MRLGSREWLQRPCNVTGCTNKRSRGGAKCDQHYREHLAAQPVPRKCSTCEAREPASENVSQCWICIQIDTEREEQEESERRLKELFDRVATLQAKVDQLELRLLRGNP